MERRHTTVATQTPASNNTPDQTKAPLAISRSEIDHYHELGLGRGVNVTDSQMWKTKSPFLVRRINSNLGNIIGTQECGILEHYRKETYTLAMRQQSLRLSLDDPTSHVKIGMDEDYSQSTSSTKIIEGKKIETRTISFEFDIDDVPLNSSYKKADSEAPVHFLQDESDKFERSLCIWILKRIKDRRDKEEDTLDKEKDQDLIKLYKNLDLPKAIEQFSQQKEDEESGKCPLWEEVEQGKQPASGHEGERSGLRPSGQEGEQSGQSPSGQEGEQSGQPCTRKPNSPISMLSLILEKFRFKPGFLRLIIQDCKDFVKYFGITHYVSAIKLGACQYRVVDTHSKQTKLGGGADAGAASVAKGRVSGSSTKRWFDKSEEEQKIGRISEKETVERENEAVIGFQIQPIHKLVRVQFIQVILQKSIKEYILSKEDKCEGPFLISCEINHKPVYWTIKFSKEGGYQVMGTTTQKDANLFYVIPTGDPACPSEFFIAYWGETEKDRVTMTHLYEEHRKSLQRDPPLPRYLSTESNFFGKCSGPLTLKTTVQTKQARFCLYSRVQDSFACMLCLSSPACPGDWIEGEQFYINCSHHSIKFDGFIAMEKCEEEHKAEPSYKTLTQLTLKDPPKGKERGMLFRLHPPEWKKVRPKAISQQTQTENETLEKNQETQTEDDPAIAPQDDVQPQAKSQD